MTPIEALEVLERLARAGAFPDELSDINTASETLRAAIAPSHTDLMVTPESMDK